jgi:fructose-bisphosphate aldolase class 1
MIFERSEHLITEGLDSMRERLAESTRLGARFSKWCAVITIGAHDRRQSSVTVRRVVRSQI